MKSEVVVFWCWVLYSLIPPQSWLHFSAAHYVGFQSWLHLAAEGYIRPFYHRVSCISVLGIIPGCFIAVPPQSWIYLLSWLLSVILSHTMPGLSVLLCAGGLVAQMLGFHAQGLALRTVSACSSCAVPPAPWRRTGWTALLWGLVGSGAKPSASQVPPAAARTPTTRGMGGGKLVGVPPMWGAVGSPVVVSGGKDKPCPTGRLVLVGVDGGEGSWVTWVPSPCSERVVGLKG